MAVPASDHLPEPTLTGGGRKVRILLVRHGRQSDARCNVDVGLSAAGRQQADLAGGRLAGERVNLVVSSDMIRARETAQILNAHVAAPSREIAALRELDFGEMEGLTDDEIDTRFSEFKTLQARGDRDLHYPGGESASDVLERALAALEALADGGFDTVAIATHGVVIRVLAAHALGAPAHRWRAVARSLENGSITELRYDTHTHTLSLERLNDYAHLEANPELLRAAWGVREN
ncbi:MAG: histidine phosphatase family protein [Dermabacter sp.]|nr:histidine phosphatase family protein [Dermabacter sp.]